MALNRPRSSPDRGASMRSALGVLAGSLAILLPFATANAIFGRGFGLSASPGWYLYARAAQFANCDRFTPPGRDRGPLPGAAREPAPGHALLPLLSDLAARSGISDRSASTTAGSATGRGGRSSPSPATTSSSFWDNLRGYWLPDLRPASSTLPIDPWRIDNGLDPQLAFTNGFDTGLYDAGAERRSGPRPAGCRP